MLTLWFGTTFVLERRCRPIGVGRNAMLRYDVREDLARLFRRRMRASRRRTYISGTFSYRLAEENRIEHRPWPVFPRGRSALMQGVTQRVGEWPDQIVEESPFGSHDYDVGGHTGGELDFGRE